MPGRNVLQRSRSALTGYKLPLCSLQIQGPLRSSLKVVGSRVGAKQAQDILTKYLTLQKESFPDFFFNFLERRFGTNDAIAWAYTIFESIKLFHSNEIMSQFYAVLIGKVSFGLGPTGYPSQVEMAFVPSTMALSLHSSKQHISNCSPRCRSWRVYMSTKWRHCPICRRRWQMLTLRMRG